MAKKVKTEAEKELANKRMLAAGKRNRMLGRVIFYKKGFEDLIDSLHVTGMEKAMMKDDLKFLCIEVEQAIKTHYENVKHDLLIEEQEMTNGHRK